MFTRIYLIRFALICQIAINICTYNIFSLMRIGNTKIHLFVRDLIRDAEFSNYFNSINVLMSL